MHFYYINNKYSNNINSDIENGPNTNINTHIQDKLFEYLNNCNICCNTVQDQRAPRARGSGQGGRSGQGDHN